MMVSSFLPLVVTSIVSPFPLLCPPYPFLGTTVSVMYPILFGKPDKIRRFPASLMSNLPPQSSVPRNSAVTHAEVQVCSLWALLEEPSSLLVGLDFVSW